MNYRCVDKLNARFTRHPNCTNADKNRFRADHRHVNSGRFVNIITAGCQKRLVPVVAHIVVIINRLADESEKWLVLVLVRVVVTDIR